MTSDDAIRIDKWLWAVRVFKTRSMATNACKKGKVLIDDISAKPSRSVKIGEIIQVKNPPIMKTFKVKGPLGKRVSAKLAVQYVEDLTPEEEIEKLRLSRSDFFGFREKGAGRPTKKERRILDKLKDQE
jgi:ribosome-associated heat shock protein Hsp15